MNAKAGISVSTALLECLLFSGVIIGWPNLQRALQSSGHFTYLCKNHTSANNTGIMHSFNFTTFNANTLIKQGFNFTGMNQSDPAFGLTRSNLTANEACPEQQEAFNLIFTLSMSALSLAALPLGHVIDRYGTWAMRCVATTLCTTAFACLSRMDAHSSWLLYPCMTALSISGLALLISNCQLSKLTTSLRSVYVTILNGMFDASALVFLLAAALYDRGIHLSDIFAFLACASALPWLRTFLVMPRKLLQDSVDPDHQGANSEHQDSVAQDKLLPTFSEQSVSENTKEIPQSNLVEKKQRKSSSNDQKSISSCFRTASLWTNILHFSLNNLQMGVFVGTLITWLEGFVSEKALENYTEVFGVMLIGGAVAAPLNGLLTDGVIGFYRGRVRGETVRTQRGLCVSALCTSCLGIALAVVALAKQVLTSFVLFVLFRAFVAGFNATFVSLSFPLKHFGRVYGLCQIFAGLVSLLQYALFKITVEFDPSFTIIRLTMLVLSLITLAHPYLLYRQAFVNYKNEPNNNVELVTVSKQRV